MDEKFPSKLLSFLQLSHDEIRSVVSEQWKQIKEIGGINKIHSIIYYYNTNL